MGREYTNIKYTAEFPGIVLFLMDSPKQFKILLISNLVYTKFKFCLLNTRLYVLIFRDSLLWMLSSLFFKVFFQQLKKISLGLGVSLGSSPFLATLKHT